MRNGFKVFDTDTHFSPMAETIEPYLGPDLRARVPDLDERKVEFKVLFEAVLLGVGEH